MSTLKQLGKDTIIYFAGNVIVRTSSFLLIPFYTNVLSINEYGLLSLLLLLKELLFIFMHGGLRTAFLKYSASDGFTKSIFGNVFCINIFMGLLIIFIFSWNYKILSSLLHIPASIHLFILLSISSLTHSLFVLFITIYRRDNNPIKYSVVSFASTIILILLTIYLLKYFDLGINGIFYSQIIVYIIFSFIIYFYERRHISLCINSIYLKKIAFFSFPFIFSMSSSILITVGTSFLLNIYYDLETVAIYSLGFKFSTIAEIAIISSFQVAFEPFTFKNINTPKFGIKIGSIITYLFLALIICVFILISFIHTFINLIAPPEYNKFFIVTVLLLPAIFFRALYYIGEAILSGFNKSVFIGTIAATTTLFGLLLSFILIRLWSINGAILAFSITLLLRSFLIFIRALRLADIIFEYKRTLYHISYIVILLVLAYSISSFDNVLFMSILLISMFLYIILYFRINIINDIEIKYLNKFKYLIYSKLNYQP